MSETHAESEAVLAKDVHAFSGRAGAYVRYRPGYPRTAIDAIFDGLGDPARLVAVDIGAGTGIASRLLAERGAHVIAIEPNVAMRQAADPHPSIEFREATAERTDLPEASTDLLTCFQAFHWFDSAPTLAEFRRVLKPSGRLAIVWNDWQTKDEFFADFGRVVRKAAPNHRRGARHRGAANPLLSSPHFARVRRRTFTHWHELDLSGLAGYAQSKSFVPREGPARQQLLVDLKAVHARWADERGLVRLAFRTIAYIAQPQRGRLLMGWRRLNQAVGNILPRKALH